MGFRFQPLQIPGVWLIAFEATSDDRGYLAEIYRFSEFAPAGVPEKFVQDVVTFSHKDVVRGLHFQRPPRAQAKVVAVLRGEVFDVVVDLREESQTFGKWVGMRLSASEYQVLYVPEGFAHGFCVLSDETLLLYKMTQEFSPEHEGGIAWDDPLLSISWPVSKPLLSERDRRWPGLDAARGVFSRGAGP